MVSTDTLITLKKAMVKNIVFDLGGVIVPLNREACNRAFSNIGFKDFNSLLNDYVQEGFFLQYEKGLLTTSEFRDIIRSHIDPLMTKGKVTDLEIDKSMGAFLERISFEKILLLEKLKEKYRVFLLSNTNPIAINVVKEYFREHGKNMNDCFEKMFLSYEMNLAKPDPKIFEEMLTDGGMVASQTLFIDDAPANIEIAKESGIQTYLFGKDDSLVDVMYTCLK